MQTRIGRLAPNREQSPANKPLSLLRSPERRTSGRQGWSDGSSWGSLARPRAAQCRCRQYSKGLMLSGGQLVDIRHDDASYFGDIDAIELATLWVDEDNPGNEAAAISFVESSERTSLTGVSKRTAAGQQFILRQPLGGARLNAQCRDENSHRQPKHRPPQQSPLAYVARTYLFFMLRDGAPRSAGSAARRILCQQRQM